MVSRILLRRSELRLIGIVDVPWMHCAIAVSSCFAGKVLGSEPGTANTVVPDDYGLSSSSNSDDEFDRFVGDTTRYNHVSSMTLI